MSTRSGTGLEVLSHTFESPELVRDWLAGEPEASRFYPGHPADLTSYRSPWKGADEGDPVDPAEQRSRREAVAESLTGGGAQRDSRLLEFVRDEGFVVTTGQQPGLLGGPLYVVYKALTAIALAERLQLRLGKPVLPVFWIGSEDHDWEEARTHTLLDQENELRRVELPADSSLSPSLYRRVPGDALSRAVEELLSHLPETEFSEPWAHLLRQSASSRSSHARSFEVILEGLLADRGLFLLTSHAPVLKASTSALLLRELEHSEESEAALEGRVRELSQAGFSSPVSILSGATNVFVAGREGRDRLLRTAEGFRARHSGEEWTLEELGNLAAAHPEALSPNVLLRPVVEAAFLPTLAYVGGPGEMAYLAQTAPLFSLHGLGRPMVHPRASLTLVEGKIGKVMEKYDLDLQTLARPHDEVANLLVREELPEEIRRAVGTLRGEVARGTKELAQAVATLDPTLSGVAQQVRSAAFTQLDEVEKKVRQALKRENAIALQQVAKAQRHFFPDGKPQERSQSIWYYLSRYGDDLLDELTQESREAVLPE
ncbi:MAG: bacillithiol biosynthesis cysteine-adding enzyme BshC [Gemmatimonadota bacterium]